jgi:hypothetical protein
MIILCRRRSTHDFQGVQVKMSPATATLSWVSKCGPQIENLEDKSATNLAFANLATVRL